MLIAAAIGSITLIPAFVAFLLAAALLNNGAGYMQVAAFVSTPDRFDKFYQAKNKKF